MLTILGTRLFLTARVKNRRAARPSRLAVSKKSTGVALFIHGTIPVTIFPADLDIGFVQAPTLADRTDASFALPFTKGFLQHRDELDDTAVHRGMIDEQAALLHHLFEIAQTQRVGDVPPHAEQHDVQWKSQPLYHASRIALSNAGFA